MAEIAEILDDDYFSALLAAEAQATAARREQLGTSPSALSLANSPVSTPQTLPQLPLQLRVLLSYYTGRRIAVKVLLVRPVVTPQVLPGLLLDIFAKFEAVHEPKDAPALIKAAKRLKTTPLLSYGDRLILIPLKFHQQLIATFDNKKVVTEFRSIPPFVLDLVQRGAPSSFEPDISSISPRIYNAMLPFQKVGIETAVKLGGKMLLAYDPLSEKIPFGGLILSLGMRWALESLFRPSE